MLAGKSRRIVAAALVAALAASVAVIPAADAKKKKGGTLNVGGSVTFFVPSFDPNTNQSLASGTINAGKGCGKLRVVRVAYFTADGVTPAPNTAQPSVVSAPGGSFFVALREPSSSNPPETFVLRAFVEAKKTEFKGRKVNCKQLLGPPAPVLVTD